METNERIMEKIRLQEFPHCGDWVYLNSATEGLFPARSRTALDDFLRQVEKPYERNDAARENAIAAAKNGLSVLLNCTPREIALTGSTSEGVNIVARGFCRPGEEVLLPDCEFPANIYPWLQMEKSGVKVRFIPTRQGQFTLEDIKGAISSKTKILALSYVQYDNGFTCALEEIGQLCREENIYLFVDASQALGALPINVRKQGIAFLSSTAHKWMLGPYGVGIFYCREDLCREFQCAYLGWRSIALPPETRQYELREKIGAARFEIGTPNYPGIYALTASVSLLTEIGIENIYSRVTELASLLAGALTEKGYRVAFPRKRQKSGIVSFPAKRQHVLLERLYQNRVITVARRSGIRLSPHFFNTYQDLEYLIHLL